MRAVESSDGGMGGQTAEHDGMSVSSSVVIVGETCEETQEPECPRENKRKQRTMRAGARVW